MLRTLERSQTGERFETPKACVRSAPRAKEIPERQYKATRHLSSFERCPPSLQSGKHTSSLHTSEGCFMPWRTVTRKSLKTYGNEALEDRTTQRSPTFYTRFTDVQELTNTQFLNRVTSEPLLLLFSSQNTGLRFTCLGKEIQNSPLQKLISPKEKKRKNKTKQNKNHPAH